jgi:hypothetical protein
VIQLVLPISPSSTTSMPTSACLRTTSATALRTWSPSAASS